MRKRYALSLSLIIGSAVFTPAAAAPVTYCSPSALQVCSAFDASTVYTGGKWHLILKVWNAFDGTAANGLSHAVTFAGIGSSWVGTAVLKSAKFNGVSVGWKLTSNINNNVVGAGLDFASSSKNGINQGLVGCNQPIPPGVYQTCLPGGPMLVLDFETSSKFNLTGAVYGWHSQAINSTECSLWADSQGNSTATSSGACSTTVTPEPVTAILIGTGLAGIGYIRRRRKQDEILPTA